MSEAQLLKRPAGRAAEAASETEIPRLTHRTAARPVPRTLGHWFLIAALSGLTATSAWLVVAGTSVARSNARLAEVMFHAPTFDDYLVATQPGKTSLSPKDYAPLTPSETEAVTVPAMVERVFASISQFENSRAEFRLGTLRSVLLGVLPGSPANLAGLQRGDELTSIAGRPVAFVWELMSFLSAHRAAEMDVEFRRGAVLYKTRMTVASGGAIDLANSGLLVEFPEGVRFLSDADTRRLAEEFIRSYVEAIPPEWRKTYVASLDALARALGRRAEDQKQRAAQDPAYLRSEHILSWHHESFVASMERLRAESTAATQSSAASLGALGRAAAGTGSALVVSVIAFGLFSRSRRPHPRRV